MREIATHLVERLRAAGHQALLAGGCVRDTLLGRTPRDFDIATSALPEEIQALFPRTVAVGAAFGVIVVLEQGHEFQVATFRSDGPYRDGRHPESVSFTTAEGDAARRDFTVNGLLFDPVEEKVIDFVGGRQDLESRTIRCIGDPASRFAEDHLRLIRAVRFAATLGFTIDPATWQALVEAAPSILTVSAERIRDELVKILTHPSRLAGFDLLDRSTLLAHILPEIETLKGCDQPPDFHPEGDVFVHTRLMLSLLGAEVPPPLVLSVLLHDIGKPPCRHIDETGRIRFSGHESVGADMSKRIMERLRFPNAETSAVVEAVRNHMSFKDVKNMRTSTLKRFLARPTIDDELELHRVDCAASHGMLDNHAFLLAKREEFSNEPLIPPPLVTGRDLIALGAKPGPEFKKTLTAAQSLQLEGTLATREEALEWIASHHPLPHSDTR
jgi:tRNA nucleotidyltransferase/poly(A) polymerase